MTIFPWYDPIAARRHWAAAIDAENRAEAERVAHLESEYEATLCFFCREAPVGATHPFCDECVATEHMMWSCSLCGELHGDLSTVRRQGDLVACLDCWPPVEDDDRDPIVHSADWGECDSCGVTIAPECSLCPRCEADLDQAIALLDLERGRIPFDPDVEPF